MLSTEKLCSLNAVSGKENEVSDYLKKYLKDFTDNLYVDDMGNVIADINNDSNVNIMLEAHMDQIGLVVREIDKNGFIKFACSGGIDSSILPTAEVTVHGKKNIYGVIGAKPPHLQTKEDSENKNDSKSMYIDCGFSFEELKDIVKIGDTISLVSDYKYLKNNYVSSGSLDNRIGVYVISECMKRLKDKNIPYNITALYSVQEEVGCRGAITGTERIKPDIAIIVDVTFGISPYNDDEHGFETDKGITVAVGPNLNRQLSEKFISNCNSRNIFTEKEVCGGNTGTDAWPIQIMNEGVQCILVSVPIKYMHTTVETASTNDIDDAVDAICSAIEGGIF